MLSREDHISYLKAALELARKSPVLPTNFCVGAVIVADSEAKVLATGYTMELPGNTHAEECALAKLQDLKESIPAVQATLYTTLEPCGKRLSGRTSCVDRILARGLVSQNVTIHKVIFGAMEPDTFVQDSDSCRRMTEAGLGWEYIPDLADQILEVAKEGHKDKAETNVDDISSEERERQMQMPRNPKKRMMEVPPG